MSTASEKWAFLGLHYFDDDPTDRQLFFGRDAEIKELTEKVLAENVTILFSRSGDGKTSLINAGLKPSLRNLNYFPVRARVFSDTAKHTPIDSLYYAIETESSRSNFYLPLGWRKSTMWETFYFLRPTEENKLKPMVLIFDQFEELFTLMENRKKEKDEFLTQFSDLVRGRLPQAVRENLHEQLGGLTVGSKEAVEIERLLFGSANSGTKVVLSLREDYLAFLENLDEQIPTVFDNRFRLDPLSRASAREAIDKPPQQPVLGRRVFKFNDDAIDEMLNFLTEESSRAGKGEEVVGPPQLQILCRQLEEKIRNEERSIITIDDLDGEKGMRRHLRRYYREIYNRFPIIRFGWGPKRRQALLGLLSLIFPFHFPRLAIRKLCEDRLITASGSRNSRHEEEIVSEIGVAEKDLSLLIETRLLRREPRLKEAFYELSHDSLIQSLRIAGNFRRNLSLSAKIICVTIIFTVSAYWIFPYILGKLVLGSLEREFLLTQQGKMSTEAFKENLTKLGRSEVESPAINQLENAFHDWRLNDLATTFLASKNIAASESTLKLIKIEYPLAPQIPSFGDTLHRRKVQEIGSIYSSLLPDSQNVFRKSQLDSVSSIINSAYLDLDRDPEITLLQADLAGKYGDWSRKQFLLKEVERQNEILRNRMLSAIKLKKPEIFRIKGNKTGQPIALEIVLEPDDFLQGFSIKINEQEIADNRSFIIVKPDSNEVVANVRVTNHQGLFALKTFYFEIDRTPPTLIDVQIYYRNSDNGEWVRMMDGIWQGNYWQVRGQVDEKIMSCNALFNLTRWHQKIFIGATLNDGRSLVIEGTNKEFSTFEKLNLDIELTDLVGWKSSISLGEWNYKLLTKSPKKPLRSTPQIISLEEVISVLSKHSFFDFYNNKEGHGFINDYREFSKQEDRVIIDRSAGLMWQESGSTRLFSYKNEVLSYIDELNEKEYAGFNEWRLPTFEEAISLVEPMKSNDSLYINDLFDSKQTYIWTADEAAGDRLVWFVNFELGALMRYGDNKMYGFVRAVRNHID